MVRTDGRAVYYHVITQFSGMVRFTYAWCSVDALRAPELRYKHDSNFQGFQKYCVVSNDDLEHLSMEIESWLPLARRLRFSRVKILAFNAYEDVRESVYRMLIAWKAREGSHATYRVLYDALCHELVGRRDLAEMFCLVRPSLVST